MPPNIYNQNIGNLTYEILPYMIVFCIGVCFVIFGYARSKFEFDD